jgi:hypothetical protein
VRIGPLIAVFLISTLCQELALADPSPSELQAARDLFAQASKDEERQDWAGALEKLKRVASIKTTPGVRSHIAACEEKLGQLVLALADYTAAESLAKQQNNGEVLAAIADPMAKLKARIPTMTINAPADATVMLDERRLAPGVLGVPMPIDPGTHRVDAKSAGKPPYGATIRIKEKDALTLDVKFETQATEPPTTDPVPPPPPKTDPRPVHVEPPPGAAPPARKSGGLAPGIASAGGAVGLLALGIGAFALADGAQGDLKAACAAGMMCDDKKAPVHAWDTVALISWIGAVGLAGLSVYFFVTSGKSQKSEARFVISPTGAALRGSF